MNTNLTLILLVIAAMCALVIGRRAHSILDWLLLYGAAFILLLVAIILLPPITCHIVR